jgi:hypothetical protein
MKKIMLFCLLMVAFVATQAQVKLSEGVKSYVHSATVEKDDAVTNYYYIPDFCTAFRIQTDMDTVAAGYIKVSIQAYGSLDYSNWVAIGSALVTSGAGASATNTALNSTVHYNYLKIVGTAVDSTQFIQYKYKLLIDKN